MQTIVEMFAPYYVWAM